MPATDLTTAILAMGQFYTNDGAAMLGNLGEVATHQQNDIVSIEAMRARFIELGHTTGLNELDAIILKFQSGELVDACSNINWFSLLMNEIGFNLTQYGELLEGIEPEPSPTAKKVAPKKG